MFNINDVEPALAMDWPTNKLALSASDANFSRGHHNSCAIVAECCSKVEVTFINARSGKMCMHVHFKENPIE